MSQSKAVFLILVVALVIPSCGGSTPAPQAILTDPVETTLLIPTETARPTNTPNATQFASVPGTSFTVVPPQADEQTYMDPDGWYSLNFPANLFPTDAPNVFAGQQRILGTGYLPYASNSMHLCLWIANILLLPEQSNIQWQPPCSVSGTDGTYKLQYIIYENPLADLEHRFIYIKMGEAGTVPAPYIPHTVSWLKAASQTISGSAPLNSEESSFWENPNTMLTGALSTEYVLPPEAQTGPTNEMLLRYTPEEAQPDWAALRQNASTSQEGPTKEEQLKSLGYELERIETPCCRQQLYRDGRILFDNVTDVSDVYRFSSDSRPITAFSVTTNLRDSFLILNDTINEWEDSPVDPGFAPILYQGGLLWAKGTQDSRVQVKRSNGDVLFTFETYFGTHLEVDSFKSWKDHWILTAGDFLIQDGEILNQTLGFQEIFEWSVVDGKPVYLFRRGSRLGLSYDGKFLLLPYEDIPRGLCCGFASNNPMTIDDTMYFFGKRDGTWYYAVVKFR